MVDKNQYTLYLDKLQTYVNKRIINTQMSPCDKRLALSLVKRLILECVPFYYEHAINHHFLVKITELEEQYSKECYQKELKELEKRKKAKLSSSRMTKHTTVAKSHKKMNGDIGKMGKNFKNLI